MKKTLVTPNSVRLLEQLTERCSRSFEPQAAPPAPAPRPVPARAGRPRQTARKPWTIDRLKHLMAWWDLTQFEFSIFANVSYDSVASWSNGRRSFDNDEHTAFFDAAAETARQRGFADPVGRPSRSVEARLRPRGEKALIDEGITPERLPANLVGTWPILAYAPRPAEARTGEGADRITIAPQDDGTMAVTIDVGGATVDLIGIWRDFRGTDVLDLARHDGDHRFLADKVGFITTDGEEMQIALWATDPALPIRLLAYGVA